MRSPFFPRKQTTLDRLARRRQGGYVIGRTTVGARRRQRDWSDSIPIIAVDFRVSRQLLAELARATMTVDPTGLNPIEAVWSMSKNGVHFSRDTIVVPSVIAQAVDSLTRRGFRLFSAKAGFDAGLVLKMDRQKWRYPVVVGTISRSSGPMTRTVLVLSIPPMRVTGTPIVEPRDVSASSYAGGAVNSSS